MLCTTYLCFVTLFGFEWNEYRSAISYFKYLLIEISLVSQLKESRMQPLMNPNR